MDPSREIARPQTCEQNRHCETWPLNGVWYRSVGRQQHVIAMQEWNHRTGPARHIAGIETRIALLLPPHSRFALFKQGMKCSSYSGPTRHPLNHSILFLLGPLELSTLTGRAVRRSADCITFRPGHLCTLSRHHDLLSLGFRVHIYPFWP